jgi:hypothetical protein
VCVTIQLVVPTDAAEAVTGALSRQMPFWGEPIGTAPNGDVVLGVMGARGQCQCTTSLGSVQPPARLHGADSRKIAAMRRQGWSEHKIERWLAEKQRSETKYERALHVPADGATVADLDSWRAVIEDLFGRGLLNSVSLHVGFDYQAALHGEPIVVPLDEVSTTLLRGLAYDSLYTFVSAA